MQALTGEPRALLTSDQVRELLIGDEVEVSSGLELVDENGVKLQDLTDNGLVDGQVTRNCYADVHGTASFKLSQKLKWGLDRVRPFMFLSSSKLWPMTTVVIDRPAASASRVDDTDAEWGEGTLTDTVASGGLELAPIATPAPSTVPGLLAFLDPATLGVGEGASVTAAPSGGSSGTGWTAQNGGVTFRAAGQNGEPYLEQSAAGGGLRWLVNRSATDSTVIYVAKNRGAQRVMGGASNNWLLGWWSGLENQMYAGAFVSNPSDPTTTDVRIWSGSSAIAADTYALYRDGTLVASNNAGSYGPNGITTNGSDTGAEYSASDVYAVLVYDHVLTAGERATVHTYLSERFGITVSDANPPQYKTSGSRVSPLLSLASLLAVDTSSVSWQASTPSGSTIVVETSVDGGATWQQVLSGAAIPGVSPGDDVLSRVTITGNGTSTPTVSSLSVSASQSQISHNETTYSPVRARFDLGVYVVTSPERPIGEDPETYDVTGYDLLYLLQPPVGDTYVVEGGVTYLQAVRDVLTASGVGSQVILDGTLQNTVLPGPMVWCLDDGDSVSWLRIINDLLAAINYRGIWCDEQGRFRSEPYANPSVRSVEWTFETTVEGKSIVSEDRTEKNDTWGAPNWWRFIRKDMTTPPVEGDGIYTVINQSDGDSSIDAMNGRIIRADPQRLDAADQASLVAQGDKIVAEARAISRIIEFDSAPFPIAGHFDVAAIHDEKLGGTVKVQAQSWVLPLNGANMSWVWEAV